MITGLIFAGVMLSLIVLLVLGCIGSDLPDDHLLNKSLRFFWYIVLFVPVPALFLYQLRVEIIGILGCIFILLITKEATNLLFGNSRRVQELEDKLELMEYKAEFEKEDKPKSTEIIDHYGYYKDKYLNGEYKRSK